MKRFFARCYFTNGTENTHLLIGFETANEAMQAVTESEKKRCGLIIDRIELTDLSR